MAQGPRPGGLGYVDYGLWPNEPVLRGYELVFRNASICFRPLAGRVGVAGIRAGVAGCFHLLSAFGWVSNTAIHDFADWSGQLLAFVI